MTRCHVFVKKVACVTEGTTCSGVSLRKVCLGQKRHVLGRRRIFDQDLGEERRNMVDWHHPGVDL